MEDGVLAPLGSDGLHHIGATVADLDRSLAFWEPFLGRARRFKVVLERPYLGQVLGFPGVKIDAAFVDMPGGVVLELLDYRLPDRVPHVDDTRHPGNVHLCFRVEDADAAWRRAVALGATPVNPDGPVELDGGPNKGAKVAYLRDPDGISLELFQLPPHLVERRYERLSADGLARLREAAPVAYVPIGTLEHHGPHLPYGVDGITAHELALRAARVSGGVVLPASYLATGCLDLPGTLTFSPGLVERWAQETIAQLHARGFHAVVLLSGHGPMDLLHLLKRVGREQEAALPGLRTYALHWLELAAASHDGLDDAAPGLVDHAGAVETSWMLAVQPEDVRLDRLPADPDAPRPPGVYGVDPRQEASAALGAERLNTAVELLAERAGRLLAGEEVEALADLDRFVERFWPEPLRLTGRAGDAGSAALLLANPGAASRLLTGLHRLRVDGTEVALGSAVLVNHAPGENGVPVAVRSLGPEAGLYVRHGQAAELRLGVPVQAGSARIELSLELGGVATREFDELVPFA
jgi:creatinine amidohydrolase/Fe(II)-dependent formamide hydrolase-like protein/catechol 2,3-dioxygenase-like lactoylglutathione lyase family enzyme